jgi:hypothetical protein
MSFKYSMDPRVSYLSELLKEVNEGIIKIPRFQRELVWEWTQQRDLLCSIFEGLPIGALLIWRTRMQNIRSYERIGPFPVAINTGDVINTYLMDGLQRVSTLYGMVYPFEGEFAAKDRHLSKRYEVYCDLESETVDDLFLLESEISRKDRIKYAYRFMRLNLVFNTRELLRFQRTIPTDREELLDKIEDIVSAFKNYKIPVIPLETDDQELVTKSFERINTRGTTMSETHMLNALSYSADFDFLAELEQQRERFLGTLPNWRELDVKFVLLLLKNKLGFDPYSKNTDKLAKKISTNAGSIAQVFSAVEKLSKFSEAHLNIDNPNDFPYRLQMLGIASEFFHPNYIRAVDKLKSWFWITTYMNSFGTTARNSQRSLEDLRVFISTGTLPWSSNMEPTVRPLEGLDVNYKSARIKAWAYALAKRLDEVHQTGDHKDMLKRYKGACLVQACEFAGHPKRPGNCFLVDPKLAKTFSVEDLSAIDGSGHFVAASMRKHLKNGMLDRFVTDREREMFMWEQKEIILPALTTAGRPDLLNTAG